MSGTVLALFGVCLGVAILELALPGEERESPKAFLQFFASLLVLILIVGPLFSLPQAVEDALGDLQAGAESTEDFEQILQDAVAMRSKEQLEAGVGAWLEENFALAPGAYTVCATLDRNGELCRITVRLQGVGLLRDPAEIEQGLCALLGCETEVR